MPAKIAHHTARIPLESFQCLAHAAELPRMGASPHVCRQPRGEAVVGLPQLDPGLRRRGDQPAAGLLVEPSTGRMRDHSGGLRGCTAATIRLHISITAVSTASRDKLSSSNAPDWRPASIVFVRSHSTPCSPIRSRQRTSDDGSIGGRCRKNTSPVKCWSETDQKIA